MQERIICEIILAVMAVTYFAGATYIYRKVSTYFAEASYIYRKVSDMLEEIKAHCMRGDIRERYRRERGRNEKNV